MRLHFAAVRLHLDRLHDTDAQILGHAPGCPMQTFGIGQNKPEKCPKCGMKLWRGLEFRIAGIFFPGNRSGTVNRKTRRRMNAVLEPSANTLNSAKNMSKPINFYYVRPDARSVRLIGDNYGCCVERALRFGMAQRAWPQGRVGRSHQQETRIS